jgi:hypothetical protein
MQVIHVFNEKSLGYKYHCHGTGHEDYRLIQPQNTPMNHITMAKSQQNLGGERWLNCFESDGHCRQHSWVYNKHDCSSWQVLWFVIFWCLSRTWRRQVEIMNHGQITCRMLLLVLMCIWHKLNVPHPHSNFKLHWVFFGHHQNCIPLSLWTGGEKHFWSLLTPSHQRTDATHMHQHLDSSLHDDDDDDDDDCTQLVVEWSVSAG